MIPVLRSLDNLLNRFDELSQRHSSLISDFETNFTDIENPLHDVTRDENERRRTSENLLKLSIEDDNNNDDQLGSRVTIDDFHRRLSKNRCGNRPPSYMSNETTSIYNQMPSRNSWATIQSAPLPQTTTKTTNISRITKSKSTENFLDQPTNKTKTSPHISNLAPLRRNPHQPITTFTLQTAIRLSKPKTTRQLTEDKLSPKRIQRRLKPFQSPTRETTQSSNTSIPKPPPPPPVQRPLLSTSQPKTKRANPTTKPSPKKQKIECKLHVDNSKRIPMSNYPHPTVLLTAPPTISLTFPMQPELNSSRVIVQPKQTNPPKKTTNIFTNKRPLISPNRFIFLMT